MKLTSWALSATLCMFLSVSVASAADQTVPGAGNGNAIALAAKSPMVHSAFQFLLAQAAKIKDEKVRKETLAAISNPRTCVTHRARLTDAQKNVILQTLINEGLLNPGDAAGIQGGAKAGVFPPVLDENSSCPRRPQTFFSAPGSTFPLGHHSRLG